MRNNWEQHDGILLQEIPFLEASRILKIFTRDAGLLTLMARRKINAIPFSRAEWVVKKSRGEFYSLRETSLINPYLELRTNYETLVGAGSIARDLLRSQAPSKASPGLYELLIACFSHLQKNPNTLAQSFRLKLLHYEGVLRLEPTCVHCKEPSLFLSGGESVCTQHRSVRDSFFTDQEWQVLLTLSSARRFSEIEQFHLSTEFSNKIEQLFSQRIC